MGKIGGSTGNDTKTTKRPVAGTEPASFRYNNPGAQWPSDEAARFGQLGYGVIGGGNQIALFPSPVNGAASNFELLNRRYVGMAIGLAGKKWTGSNGFGVPGYNPNQILTAEMLGDAKQAIAFLKAIAARESGRGNNLTEVQWRQAHRMFVLDSADAFLAELSAVPEPDPAAAASGPSGAGLVRRAKLHIGEKYENVLVPKDDPDWSGPWDCAEFVSWLVYQEGSVLFGCTDDDANPARAEAYTGAWKLDALSKGILVSVEQAANTAGGILLRYPPAAGKMGHIAISDGRGGTIEAKGRRYGVVADTVRGRPWDTGVLLPDFDYDDVPDEQRPVATPTMLYRRSAPNMSAEVVTKIQKALLASGFDPGVIDGDYGQDTEAAVLAFQKAQGLTVDGIVGPDTAEALGVSLITERVGGTIVAQVVKPSEASATDPASNTTPALAANIPAILDQLFGNTSMNTSTSVQKTEQRRAVIVSALQALQSTDKIDVKHIAQAVLQTISGQQTANPGGATPQPPQTGNPALDQLITSILTGLVGSDGKLGQVNGALGQTVGNLLNGKKTAIGLIGAVLAGIVNAAPGGSALDIAKYLPLFAGTGGMFLPIFLGLLAWGWLGKLEKWKGQSK